MDFCVKLVLLAVFAAAATADNGVVKFRISSALFRKLASSSAYKNLSAINNGNIPPFSQVLPNGRTLGLTNGRLANGGTGDIKIELRSSDQSVFNSVSLKDVSFQGTITAGPPPTSRSISASAKLLQLSTRFVLKKGADGQYKFQLIECSAKAEQITGLDLTEFNVDISAADAIQRVMCSDANKQTISQYANFGISSLGRVPIPMTDLSIDLSLVEPTAIHDSDIVVTHSGTVYSAGGAVMRNEQVLPALPAMAADEGLDIQLSQFAINTAAKLNFDRNLLVWKVAQDSKPAKYLKRAFDAILEAKPGNTIELLMKARESPKIEFHPTHIQLRLPLTLSAIATSDQAREVLKTDITYDLKFPQLESMPADGFGLEQIFTNIKVEKNVQVVSTDIPDAAKDQVIATLDKMVQLAPQLYKGKAGAMAGNLPKILLQEGAFVFHANLDMACFVSNSFGAKMYMGPLCA